jgi:hypothetical protein
MTYKERRATTSRANALKSTGPKTTAGKQRSSMNACKHNLTGFHIVLQPDEMEAYNELTGNILDDLDPQTEMEHQTVQKIIDAHFRLNRLASLENNIFQFGAADRTTDSPHEDRVEMMIAQTRAWLDRGASFDILGRYESRLARQVLRFTLEFERLRRARRAIEIAEEVLENSENEELDDNLASFGNNSPEIVMSGAQTEIVSSVA